MAAGAGGSISLGVWSATFEFDELGEEPGEGRGYA
jgi:hypothetical protein